MNQPTEDRIKRLEEEQRQIKEEVRQLREQQTEPINLRIERGLPVPEATLLQTIMGMVGTQATDVALLKGSMEVVKGDVQVVKDDVSALRSDVDGAVADIKAIRESQADFRDKLQTMATKDDVSRIESIMLQILNRLPKTEGE